MATMALSANKQHVTTVRVLLVAVSLVAAAGIAAFGYRLAVGLGPTTNLSDYYPWGLWIGFDFALVAFSGGAFTLAAVVYLLNKEKYHQVLHLAILTGWVGYLSVAAILVADLGRWDRFWHFLVYPNIHSPMYEISWGLFLYTGVLTLELMPFLFERLNKPNIVRFLRRIAVPLVVAGVVISMGHQSSLGTLFVAMPNRIHELWYTPMLPLLFLVSSMGLGLSAVVLASLVAEWVFGTKISTGVLQGLARGSALVWIIYLAFRLVHLVFSGLLGKIFSYGLISFWFMVEITLMVLLPIVLFSSPRLLAKRWVLFAGAAAATVGTVLNRFNLTFTAQSVGGVWTRQPVAESVTYFPSGIEILIQAGAIALAAIGWYLAIRYLPILPNRESPQETTAQ